MLPMGEVRRGGKKWEFGISRGQLLHTGWLNKVLLYSTGNYTQYPVAKHKGKEYIHKFYIYIYIYIYI